MVSEINTDLLDGGDKQCEQLLAKIRSSHCRLYESVTVEEFALPIIKYKL